MGQVTKRTSLTSQSFVGLSPWNDSRSTYSVLQINLGNNPLSKIEIVSSLNLFNIAREMYAFNYSNRIKKYNPKVYMGAVQNVAIQWDLDSQDPEKVDEKWAEADPQKSGSWPQKRQHNYDIC